jgi:tripartite-type tricarboxylate transporter receptor subunit TctC
MRTPIAALALAMAALSAVVPASAQTYPARPITMIVPFAAGGPTDVTARIVAEHMSRTLGQQIIIENVLGAGGTTGSIRAMRANPDGYTIEMGQLGTHAASVAFYPNLAYRPETDFAYIGLAVDQAVLIIARRDFPPNDLKEFVAYVRANSEKLNMAHAGVGSVSYVGCLLLNTAIGIKPTLVPFTGSAPATNALMAGQVDYFCDPIIGQLAQISAGNVHALAIAAAARHPLLADVPSAAEEGLPQFNIAPFFALFAPKGTPHSVVDVLAATLNQTLDDSVASKRFAELGAAIAEKGRRGPAPLDALVRSEIARLTPILKAAAQK